MAVNITDLTIRRGDGPISFRINFFNLNVGGYQFYLWDPDWTSPKLIASPANTIEHPHAIYQIAQDPASLHEHGISIQANARSPFVTPEGAAKAYRIEVEFTQKGQPVGGSPIVYSGQLDGGAAPILDYARFLVV